MANDREKNADAKPKSSGLFSYSILDVKDDIDEVIVKDNCKTHKAFILCRDWKIVRNV